MARLNPMLEDLEGMEMADRNKIINAPEELPEGNISCRKCLKAGWVVVDRDLTCHCLKYGKISWASSLTSCSVRTTMCDEIYLQDARELLAKKEKQELEQEPGQTQAPRVHRQVSL